MSDRISGTPGLSPGWPTVPGDGGMPSGSATTDDANAPKIIQSDDLFFFEITGRFVGVFPPGEYDYVYAYASKVSNGVLAALVYTTAENTAQRESYSAVAPVDESLLAELQQVVRAADFASRNGYTHTVNGLPQNFGGCIRAEYTSGEFITVSDNQSPIMSPQTAADIAHILRRFMEEKRRPSPKAEDVVEVTYTQTSYDGSYTELRLQGTTLISKFRFGTDEQNLSVKEKTVPPEALDALRQMADKNALLNWDGLCEHTDPFFANMTEQVVFTLRDGRQYAINERMMKPGPGGNSLFDIRSYLMNDLAL